MDVLKRQKSILLLLGISFLLFNLSRCEDDSDSFVYDSGSLKNPQFSQAKPMRYLLYDVNPGEGFNLRRDVYIRIANLASYLNRVEPWTLVLPPWGGLYHWRSEIKQHAVPWATFFDLPSLSLHVPVIEFEDFIQVLGVERCIEAVYYLQTYEEGWTNGRWEEKADIRPCVEQDVFKQDSSGRWRWNYWGYNEVYSKHFECLSVQYQATSLTPFLINNITARSVFLVRAEELIHGSYSEWSALFWTARRSIVFAKHLRDIGDDFRRTVLDSTDEEDGTVVNTNWTHMRRAHGDARGGPYVAVHLRRRDFLYGHRSDVPTLQEAATQISQIMEKLNLTIVFIATDAPTEEYAEIAGYLSQYKVERYEASREILHKYKDGGVAIIDQWICAHARHFIGTSVSTFSFRIHEEREILGFEPSSTFNRFCGTAESECEQPSKWTVNYG